jgi:hypothetical protein
LTNDLINGTALRPVKSGRTVLLIITFPFCIVTQCVFFAFKKMTTGFSPHYRLAKYCQIDQLQQELDDAFKKADSFGEL